MAIDRSRLGYKILLFPVARTLDNDKVIAVDAYNRISLSSRYVLICPRDVFLPIKSSKAGLAITPLWGCFFRKIIIVDSNYT